MQLPHSTDLHCSDECWVVLGQEFRRAGDEWVTNRLYNDRELSTGNLLKSVCWLHYEFCKISLNRQNKHRPDINVQCETNWIMWCYCVH